MSALRAAGRFVTRSRTLGVVGACVAATAMVVACVTPVWDPDVWWVAAAGRRMLATGVVPRENVFSYVEPSHPWIMHEWLFGPPYAWLLGRLGPSAFDVVAGCGLAAALVLLAATTVVRARHLPVGLAAMAFAVAAFGGRFLSARPTGVALLFPLAMVLLAFGRTFPAWRIALVAAIEVVWANAHGSFPLGVVLLVVAALDARERGERPGRRLVAAGLAAVATLATPYGLALHRFVWEYFRGNEGVYRAIHHQIREFGPLWQAWGATVGPVDVFGLVACAALAASALRDGRLRARAALCLALVALAVLHARHVELAGLLSCTLLLPHADDLVDRLTPAPAPTPARFRLASLLLAPAFLSGPLAFSLAHRARAADAWLAPGPPFVHALAAIPDGASVFAPFAQAGMVIWYGGPRGLRVFADSRNDCYSPATLEAILALESPGTPAVDRTTTLDASRTDAALVPCAGPLASVVSVDPRWTLAGKDADWCAYRRATGSR
ncbi:MAG TPA: hypothetical protein VGG39_10250 [Polyangiaceae bacterium]|jgi:hypothetical protein